MPAASCLAEEMISPRACKASYSDERQCCALSEETLRSSGSHQSLTFPVPSKVETLVVEAVADLVAMTAPMPRQFTASSACRVEEGEAEGKRIWQGRRYSSSGCSRR